MSSPTTEGTATGATTANPGGLTDREVQLLGLAWQCFKSQPDVDIDKLAEIAGYTNPGSARNALAKAKGKIFAAAGVTVPATPRGKKKSAAGTPKSGAATTPKSGGKRKADDQDDTPSKRKKPAKAAKGEGDKEANGMEDNNAGVKEENSEGKDVKANSDEEEDTKPVKQDGDDGEH